MKKSIGLLAMMFAVTGTNMTNAQMPEKKRLQNHYSLVYEGAITENVKGKVNIHPVTYSIKDIKIVANVYTPANYNPTQKYSAIVVAHPNGGVKEQVAGLYAQRLAEQVYITITADAAYQGGRAPVADLGLRRGSRARGQDQDRARARECRALVRDQ